VVGTALEEPWPQARLPGGRRVPGTVARREAKTGCYRGKKMSRLREKTTATLLIAIFMISTFAVIIPVLANTIDSSTMHFEGTLTDNGDGKYTGTIAMTAGEYYVTGGPGESIWDQGGFDVYAQAGGTAYVEGMDPDTWIIGEDHDAYSESGPWGSWYDPDCADWDKYSLELTSDRWYLRYTPTGESPMSGIMMWRGDGKGYAAETDRGTVADDHGGANTNTNEYTSGSAQEWSWHCGWGEERIPLEYPGFEVEVTGTGDYHVKLTPAPLRGKVPVTIPIHQVQLQCRRWDPAGWRMWYWNYDTTLDIERSGKVMHAEISYSPGVFEEEGTSMVYVYNNKADKWILHEGTIKYISPYSGLWIEEYWRGYLEFDANGNFEHGVAYQWGYTYGDDPTWYYKNAVWDDTMDAWLLGFSVYIWDPDTEDQYKYFTLDPPQDLAYHKYTTTNPSHPPELSYSRIEPVPASNYNPLNQ